ncbi:ATP-binding protein [Streptomyces sp. NPDC048182]|uniref:HAMP domain-containing sensor histidine kinase n=1 Tax=Streptomyces sp. NPDC048182 TaxID=3365507 RepID=UPI003710F7A8
MTRLGRRLRTLPIRARLSLLVAAAVAFAVAAVSVTCWFIVRGRLYEQVDSDLRKATLPIDQRQISQINEALAHCTRTPREGVTGARTTYSQVVTEDGTTCLFATSKGEIKATGTDRKVIEQGTPGQGVYRTGTARDGTEVRVLTWPVPLTNPATGEPSSAALVSAVDLKGTQATLNDLALILLLVSGIGVVGAGAAGLAVARTGLRPVDRLTEAVEHVARTEDLAVRIPVEDASDDEIARLSRSFNSMTASLAGSRDLQQQLIADAGHELRTPLTSLRTNIELLTRSEETGRPIPEADRKALLASVKAQMTELATLIGDLQELSRPDTGHHTGRTRILPWHEAVDAALSRARLRGPDLTITAAVTPWYVRAEPASLERAIVNVLDNAVKFSPPGGTIDVRLADGTLTVRDHGPGVPAEELPHVFDRFWRSPTARALPGSGLGLSIVARTIHQAGGEVTLSPAPDNAGGTVATVRLPGAPTPPPEAPTSEP